MKNLIFKRVFMILIPVFLLFGCGVYGVHDNTIVNNSDFDVRFSLRQSGTYLIRAGEILTIRNQVGAVINVYESSPVNRVRFVQTDTREGEFVNLTNIRVNFLNNLNIPVFVSSGGFMENEPLLVPANSTNIYDRIFTRETIQRLITYPNLRPSFLVATEGAPATSTVEMDTMTTYAGNVNIMVVTIR